MKEILIAGLTTIASSSGPDQTIDRLVNAIRAKGLTIFARIDHAAAGSHEVVSKLSAALKAVAGEAAESHSQSQ